MTDQIVSYGWMPYIALCALISLNVGIFSLLPLPALDGGRIFILLFEKLFRKRCRARRSNGPFWEAMFFSSDCSSSPRNDIVNFFL